MKKLDFILLNGAMGSGKSTIAGLIADKLERTAILEIEDVRRLVTGSEDNGLAWNVIYKMCDEYFKNGVSVLLKQTVASQELVDKFVNLAKAHECNIHLYHLQAPRSELQKRITAREKSRSAAGLIASNIAKHEQITYNNATAIDTTKYTPREVGKLILINLSGGKALTSYNNGGDQINLSV
jgi:predicted kinase